MKQLTTSLCSNNIEHNFIRVYQTNSFTVYKCDKCFEDLVIYKSTRELSKKLFKLEEQNDRQGGVAEGC